MKAFIMDDCIARGRCGETCGEAFKMGEDIAEVKTDEIPAEYQDAVQQATGERPTSAILMRSDTLDGCNVRTMGVSTPGRKE